MDYVEEITIDQREKNKRKVNNDERIFYETQF